MYKQIARDSWNGREVGRSDELYRVSEYMMFDVVVVVAAEKPVTE